MDRIVSSAVDRFLRTNTRTPGWISEQARRGFVDFFRTRSNATRANNLYCMNLKESFPLSFGPDIWGITASDSLKGYKI